MRNLVPDLRTLPSSTLVTPSFLAISLLLISLPLKAKADQIDKLAHTFDAYLEDLKGKMTAKLDDPTDYEIMDRGDYLDENFFKGGKINAEGQEFLAEIASFRDGVASILADDASMVEVIKDVQTKFNTEEVRNRDNVKQSWLDYHYKGFPLVASYDSTYMDSSCLMHFLFEIIYNKD